MVILVVVFAFLSIWFPISYYSIRHLLKQYQAIKLLHSESVKWTNELENIVKIIDIRKLENYCPSDDREVTRFIERLKAVQIRIQNASSAI